MRKGTKNVTLEIKRRVVENRLSSFFLGSMEAAAESRLTPSGKLRHSSVSLHIKLVSRCLHFKRQSRCGRTSPPPNLPSEFSVCGVCPSERLKVLLSVQVTSDASVSDTDMSLQAAESSCRTETGRRHGHMNRAGYKRVPSDLRPGPGTGAALQHTPRWF